MFTCRFRARLRCPFFGSRATEETNDGASGGTRNTVDERFGAFFMRLVCRGESSLQFFFPCSDSFHKKWLHAKCQRSNRFSFARPKKANFVSSGPSSETIRSDDLPVFSARGELLSDWPAPSRNFSRAFSTSRGRRRANSRTPSQKVNLPTRKNINSTQKPIEQAPSAFFSFRKIDQTSNKNPPKKNPVLPQTPATAFRPYGLRSYSGYRRLGNPLQPSIQLALVMTATGL